MEDASSLVVSKAGAILDILKTVNEKVEGYLITTRERPDISYELLKLMALSDDLVQLADPDISGGEWHGVPKEADPEAKTPLKFTGVQGWDFLPWYGEKASSLKWAIKSVFNYWDTDPDEVELADDAPMTSDEWVRSGILDGLFIAEGLAKKMFDMTFYDEVKVEKLDR